MLLPSTPSLPQTKSTTEIGMARKILAQARAELDSAVAALPDIDGDETMAPPHLFQLLVRAVKARQHLTQLETLPEYLT